MKVKNDERMMLRGTHFLLLNLYFSSSSTGEEEGET